MDRVKTLGLHDLPFTYYNKDKQLANYAIVQYLISKGVHNIGLFKRLCGCFQNQGWGELAAEMIGEFKQIAPTPEKMFEISGLPQEMFPLSKAFPEGFDISTIDSWKSYMDVRGYSFDNPAPLILEVPLTIWHIINKYHLKKKSLSKNGGTFI
jgi:hypothetical protein